MFINEDCNTSRLAAVAASLLPSDGIDISLLHLYQADHVLINETHMQRQRFAELSGRLIISSGRW